VGVLDLPAPLFAGLDGLLGHALPPTGRLILWGVVGAALSMALYRALSAQARVARVKAEAAEARRALNAYDGDFEGAWPLMRRMLRLSLRQVGLVTGPAVVASLPALCLMVWLSTAYSHTFPAPGAEVAVRTVPESLHARWVTGMGDRAGPRPAPGVRVADDAGRLIRDVPLAAPVTVVHKRQWWNLLLGNPAGYLPDDARIKRIEVDLPRREYVPVGPSWARTWEAVFFTVLIACSLAIKIGFRIE
jgi:hypothetical protein